MNPIELLRKFQFRGDGYSCIGCGNLHRFGCAPDCPIVEALAHANRDGRRRKTKGPPPAELPPEPTP